MRPSTIGWSLLSLLLCTLVACPAPPEESPCPEGEVLDGETCVPERCWTGEWGAIDRDHDVVIHVATRGRSSGDGSEDDPLDSVQAAADLAAEEGGGVVAIAAGSYVGDLALDSSHDEVRVFGRCAELVELVGEDDSTEPVLRTTGGDQGLKDLSLVGGDMTLVVQGGADLEARRLDVRGCRGISVVVGGMSASLQLSDSTVHDTEGTIEGAGGVGLAAVAGARLETENVVVHGIDGPGLFAGEGAPRIEMVDTVIRDSVVPEGGSTAGGLWLFGNSSLEATRVVVERVTTYGLKLEDTSSATLEDVEIIGVAPGRANEPASAILMETGTSLEAARLTLVDTAGTGLFGDGTVALTDPEIRGTRPIYNGDQGVGGGLWVYGAGTLSVIGLVTDDNYAFDVQASSGGTAIVTDSTLSNTGTEIDGILGLALWAKDGGSITAEGVTVTGSLGAGIVGEEGTLALTDTVVRSIRPSPGDAPAVAVAMFGGELTARGLLLEDNPGTGLLATEGAQVTLDDSRIVGARRAPNAPIGGLGTGLEVQEDTHLVGRNLELVDNEYVGVLSGGLGASVELYDTTIRGTCPANRALAGILVMLDGTLVGEGLILEDNCGIGLYVDLGAHAEVTSSVIRGTLPSDSPGGGNGVVVQREASLEATDLRVEGSTGAGLYSSSGGTTSCTGCVFEGNAFAGLAAVASRISLDGGAVVGSVESADRGGGVGVFAWDVPGLPGPELSLTGVELRDHPGPALYLRGPGSYRLTDCTIADVAFGGDTFAVPGAVMALDGIGHHDPDPLPGFPGGLLVEGTRFEDLEGDALLLHDSSATLDDNVTSAVGGYDIYRQSCEEAAEPEILSGTYGSNECAGPPHPVEPRLWYLPDIESAETVE